MIYQQRKAKTSTKVVVIVGSLVGLAVTYVVGFMIFAAQHGY